MWGLIDSTYMRLHLSSQYCVCVCVWWGGWGVGIGLRIKNPVMIFLLKNLNLWYSWYSNSWLSWGLFQLILFIWLGTIFSKPHFYLGTAVFKKKKNWINQLKEAHQNRPLYSHLDPSSCLDKFVVYMGLMLVKISKIKEKSIWGIYFESWFVFSNL